MPTSLRDNTQDIRDYVHRHAIASMLDIGPGMGTYGILLNDLIPHRDAVEVWEPYIERFNLMSLYANVLPLDVWELAAKTSEIPDLVRYDLIVFGDVLEHMHEHEALAVWEWAKRIARHGVISGPLGHWPQGEVDGNAHEAHVQDHLEFEDYTRLFGPFTETFRYAHSATFCVEF